MRLAARLRQLERQAGSADPAFLVVREDADGNWWRWDEEPPVPVDRAALPANAQVVVIGERSDGPQ